MKLIEWLKKFNLDFLRIKLPIVEAEWSLKESDQDAAWELYIEMLTRITIQPLGEEEGNEETALKSVFSLFPTIREIIRRYKRDCLEFTKIAIVVLNQIVRPFTATWHKGSIEGKLSTKEGKMAFREDLKILQGKLMSYTKMLAEMAGVEDFSSIESK